jgi:hypothetical protein
MANKTLTTLKGKVLLTEPGKLLKLGNVQPGVDPDDVVTVRQLSNTDTTTLTSNANIDLAAKKASLSTALAAIAFTISYTGDDITFDIQLNAAASTLTFPVGSLCVSEGTASGDNTCSLSGVSGDRYVVSIKKIGSIYYVACKNFGQ